eukprot:CAMPEP_0206420084 /NCGR_PEP_ID=MMETSP0324_2-20121206/592_1 /ASSEMBLY_ACC=CAM_ASM_000836 /TAXON_ID=2866 /ORGANISM="Crypthecodinium cohnii, Strain Seligo" /LENGTH=61 /DNA_ID=CAMNT_0053883821 /DNA_START=101 /DNA_END=283 /DNA_ORIENTATION=-
MTLDNGPFRGEGSGFQTWHKGLVAELGLTPSIPDMTMMQLVLSQNRETNAHTVTSPLCHVW